MRLTHLLKTTALTALLLIAGKVGWGQIIIHSNDCSSATANWTFVNGGTSLAIQQTGYWLLDDAGDAITSQAFDVSGVTHVYLNYKVGTYGSGTNHPCKVEYSLNGGSTWETTTFTSITPTSSTPASTTQIDITSPGTTQLVFRWTIPTGGAKGVRIDDIAVSVPDLTAPVATFNPANSATGVSIKNKITITFDEAIRNIDNSPISDPTSLISLRKTNDVGEVVTFTSTIDATKKVITITPSADLLNDQLYYVAIAPVEDASNNATTTLSSTFTTIDATSPIISNVAITEAAPYYAGNNVTVTWFSANVDFVKIEAWVPSTSSWYEMSASSDATDGSESVTIPANAMYSTAYKIRVSYVTTSSVNSESANLTVIATPSIYEIEHNNTSGASNYLGQIVRTAGVITAITADSKNYYLQHGNGGWNGIYVYNNAAHTYVLGDSLTIIGTVDEYNNLTQIKTITSTVDNGTAVVNPTPFAISTLAASSEDYENVLVKVTNATCASGSSGTFVVNDGTGDITVFKSIYAALSLTTSRKYNITGVMTWYNGGSIYELLPRSAADVYLQSNDVTFSAFTLSGQNAKTLTGVSVTDPAADAGATMFVADFTGFQGIVATKNFAGATVEVKLNGTVVDPANYATQVLVNHDVIVAKVTAEDGTIGYYKVTLIFENRTLAVTAPASGGTYNTGSDVTTTWTSTNIANVNIWARNSISSELYQLNTTPVDATLGTFTYTIKNGDMGTVFIRVTDATDATFYAENAGTITVTDNVVPSITNRYPAVNSFNLSTSFTLSISFDESVQLGTGNLKIYNAESNAEVLSKTTTDVTFNSGSANISVSGLSLKTQYYITIDAGMFKDQSNNNLAAVAANAWKFTTTSQAGGSDLFISEYLEGSSNNKAIELFNPTGAPIDLSQYSMKKGSNGADFGTTVLTLTGTLAAGETYVIVNAGSVAAILDQKDLIDTDGKIVYFNGNDAVGLFKNNVLIDVFGTTTGTDPISWSIAGTSAASIDHTVIRKGSITHGNTNWAASAGTTTENSEWIVSTKDDFTSIGNHTLQLSSANEITAFSFFNQLSSTINSTAGTIDVLMPLGTNATSLTPTIAVSPFAFILPASSVDKDFSAPVVYTVVSQNGTPKTWTVTVTVSTTASSGKEIVTFNIPSQVSSEIIPGTSTGTVNVVMPEGTNLTSLTPTITISGAASINPASGVVQNFTSDVVYTVTAQDASTKAWTVHVTAVQTPTVSIHDIQYTSSTSGDSPRKDQVVKTSGIVTAVKLGSSGTQQAYYIQDGTGEWNGLYVYSSTPAVALGDNVTVKGTIAEYNGLTEMSPVQSVTVNSSSNALPATAAITTLAANSEAYESVFVEVKHASCSASNNGTFTVNDGSGDLAVYKGLFSALDLVVGTSYNIKGVMTWYSTGNIFELLPRDANDIFDATGIEDNLNSISSVYPNPFTNEIRFDGAQNVNRVVITSITGQIVKNVSVIENRVDTQDLPKGMYLVTFMNNKGEKTNLKMIKE